MYRTKIVKLKKGSYRTSIPAELVRKFMITQKDKIIIVYFVEEKEIEFFVSNKEKLGLDSEERMRYIESIENGENTKMEIVSCLKNKNDNTIIITIPSAIIRETRGTISNTRLLYKKISNKDEKIGRIRAKIGTDIDYIQSFI